MKRIFLFLCTCILATLTGCATNSMTGRGQLTLVSDDEAALKSRAYYQSMMGALDSKNKIMVDSPLNSRINVITNRLIQQAVLYRPKSAEWDWRVNVIDDDKTINAFCMPGGLMGIYTGLINRLEATDDEIAQVMGHEIGHAIASHGAEKMSLQVASNFAVVLASAMASKNNRDFQNNQTALTGAALAFVNLPNSRTAESEADRIGIELAARAGYNPEAALTLWEKMTDATKDKGGFEFFRTHPMPENRQASLRALSEPMAPLFANARAERAQPYDWLNGDRDARPRIDPTQAIPFYSESWERFQKGHVELKGSNLPGFLLKQSSLASHYAKSSWRDLAVGVMETDFQLDLSFFYLSKAASGLGHHEAAKHYMGQAIELSKDDATACAKRMLLSCSGVDISMLESSR